jgi:hypothetical protein
VAQQQSIHLSNVLTTAHISRSVHQRQPPQRTAEGGTQDVVDARPEQQLGHVGVCVDVVPPRLDPRESCVHHTLHRSLALEPLQIVVPAPTTKASASARTCAPAIYAGVAVNHSQLVQVRVDIMGAPKCRNVGESQSVHNGDRSHDLHPHPRIRAATIA